MEEIEWYDFSGKHARFPYAPRNIAVMDHEGNISVGKWHDEFIPRYDFPIGFIRKWTPITMLVYTKENKVLFEFNNGEKLSITEIYEFGDLNLTI